MGGLRSRAVVVCEGQTLANVEGGVFGVVFLIVPNPISDNDPLSIGGRVVAPADIPRPRCGLEGQNRATFNVIIKSASNTSSDGGL
jgi:hypothetical protein